VNAEAKAGWGTFDVTTGIEQFGGDDVPFEVEPCEYVLELLVECGIGGMDGLAGVM
jgi:hypothetical protein